MRLSELKNIIFECLDEMGIVERGPGDPNSLDGRGPKLTIKPSEKSKPSKLARDSNSRTYLDLHNKWRATDSKLKKFGGYPKNS